MHTAQQHCTGTEKPQVREAVRADYKSMARMPAHQERTGQRTPRIDAIRVAAWTIEDCEAEGRVSPKEIEINFITE